MAHGLDKAFGFFGGGGLGGSFGLLLVTGEAGNLIERDIEGPSPAER
jgi:hypothetical protein